MDNLEMEVSGRTLIIADKASGGILVVKFNSRKKKGVELAPTFEAYNDISAALISSELKLNLVGMNLINVQTDFLLKGDVTLSRVSLNDPIVINSFLNMVYIKAKSRFVDSKMSSVGWSKYGSVTFDNCDVGVRLPTNLQNGNYKFVHNQLI